MRIVALSAGTGWHIEDLARAATRAEIDLVAWSWRSVAGAVGDGEATAWAGETTLDDANAVLLRTMPPGSLEQIIFRMDLMHRLEARGVPGGRACTQAEIDEIGGIGLSKCP